MELTTHNTFDKNLLAAKKEVAETKRNVELLEITPNTPAIKMQMATHYYSNALDTLHSLNTFCNP